jgi:hypothetical protein
MLAFVVVGTLSQLVTLPSQKEANGPQVYIMGQVEKPGKYDWNVAARPTVQWLVAEAGGMKPVLGLQARVSRQSGQDRVDCVATMQTRLTEWDMVWIGPPLPGATTEKCDSQ